MDNDSNAYTTIIDCACDMIGSEVFDFESLDELIGFCDRLLDVVGGLR